jgi:hypothetical protein
MAHVNKSKNNNSMVTAATFLTLATITVILVAGTAVIVVPLSLQTTEGQRFIDSESNFAVERKPPAAPAVVSGDNIYVAWWTNNTENGNEEVMFRASNDGGATFGDKMNLSNTPDSESTRLEIAGEGANVIVSWWETNQTSDTPVARISTDGGETFSAMLMLGTNGTLTSTEEGGVEGGETTEEEALGGAEVAE